MQVHTVCAMETDGVAQVGVGVGFYKMLHCVCRTCRQFLDGY